MPVKPAATRESSLMSDCAQSELTAGSRFSVSMQWRLDAKGSARAQFEAEVVAYDEGRDRLLCELVEIVALRTDHPPQTLEQDTLDRIKGLVGSFAYLPREASRGTTLHLKLTTLTGEHVFFFDEPPSEREETAS